MSYQADNAAFNDAMDSLSHHGILGMKWGVRNEETRRKYEGGDKSSKTEKSDKSEKPEKPKNRNIELIRKYAPKNASRQIAIKNPGLTAIHIRKDRRETRAKQFGALTASGLATAATGVISASAVIPVGAIGIGAASTYALGKNIAFRRRAKKLIQESGSIVIDL